MPQVKMAEAEVNLKAFEGKLTRDSSGDAKICW
jgi:hypothetical protein